MSAPVDVLAVIRFAINQMPTHSGEIDASPSVIELVEGLVIASKRASATLSHAYHTQLVGPLADYAHTDYQALDAALAKFGGAA